MNATMRNSVQALKRKRMKFHMCIVHAQHVAIFTCDSVIIHQKSDNTIFGTYYSSNCYMIGCMKRSNSIIGLLKSNDRDDTRVARLGWLN